MTQSIEYEISFQSNLESAGILTVQRRVYPLNLYRSLQSCLHVGFELGTGTATEHGRADKTLTHKGTQAPGIGNLDGVHIHIAVEIVTLTELFVDLLQEVLQVFGLGPDLLEDRSCPASTCLSEGPQEFVPGCGI
ncbi:MAG: hypothetical protein DRN81_02260 [Thermoproteota archaeon]|nr:MAG: hypothetical protein DRN81_02260 [Candidatus Korarchaeota archaeon]